MPMKINLTTLSFFADSNEALSDRLQCISAEESSPKPWSSPRWSFIGDPVTLSEVPRFVCFLLSRWMSVWCGARSLLIFLLLPVRWTSGSGTPKMSAWCGALSMLESLLPLVRWTSGPGTPRMSAWCGSRSLLIFLLLLVRWTSASGTPIIGTRIVHTRFGKLQGLVYPMDHSKHLKPVEVFLGIPYATPPVHSNRFSPTRTPSPWDGIRIADKLAPVCPQNLPGEFAFRIDLGLS